RYCYGFASWKSDILPGGFLKPYPDYADMELLTPEQAKKEVKKYDHEGMVHTTWTMLTPFVYHICNCTVKDCTVLKAREEMGVKTLWKGEYMARINLEECNGCRDCMRMCNFGAIRYSLSMEKCDVNTLKCWGCGICRAECRHEAITMVDRNTIPALANVW
ncbi:MAG: 4Fe-4S dicluster domain-containing protein, partial [Chloroflexota bacterium]